jgi:hypothetical protein
MAPSRRKRAALRASVSLAIELDVDGHIQTTFGRDGEVDNDPLAYLKAIRAGVRMLEEQGVKDAVRAARRQRMSWTEIGEALGVTRQSAWERYSDEP